MWTSGFFRTPAAMFVMHEMPRTPTPIWLSAMTSGTVDMPTACAPQRAERPDLGGRLVRRAVDADVDALLQRDALAASRRRARAARRSLR